MASIKRFVISLLLLGVGPQLEADLTVVQLANEGVLLSDGRMRIMIDGFVVEPYSVYGGLPPQAAVQFDQRSGIFAGVDLAFASHRHHDHNQPKFACAFLRGGERTHFYSGSQVIGLMREKCRSFVTDSARVHIIAPAYEQHEMVERGGARVRIFPLSHGTRKYARIQNFGHLVELGGLTLLHVGDAAMNEDEFARAGLEGLSIDVALIPFWYFQPGPGAVVIERFMNARFKLAVHIPPAEMEEVRAHLQQAYPEVRILENPLDQAVFSAAAPPPP